MFVADEETGGDVGAHWLCSEHPDLVRCDMLINEGGGESFDYRGRRHYGVCVAEKGIFRFNITAHGAAGHASLPRTGDNALLKLGPALARLADQPESFVVTERAGGAAARARRGPGRPGAALARIERRAAGSAHAGRADVRGDADPDDRQRLGQDQRDPGAGADPRRLPRPARPGRGGRRWSGSRRCSARTPSRYSIEFTEQVVGNQSPVQSELMSAIERWVAANDEGASAVPVILPGFSDSRWFRDAFPDCVAYGFFPQRHQGLLQAAPLVHNADERIDVRDLGFATRFFADLAREILG